MNGTSEALSAEPSKGTEGRTETRPPAWSAVLRAQVRLLVRKKWKLLTLLATGIGLITLLGLIENVESSLSGLLLESPLYVLGWLLAVGWSESIWSDEGPGERSYHWSLPVTRSIHDLTRVGLGAVFYLAVALVGLAAGGLVHALFGGSFTLGDPAVWGLMLLGIVTGFLLGTIPALLSAHPLRWTVGSALGYLILVGLLGEGARSWSWLSGPWGLVQSVWNGEYGLEAALFAPHQVAGYAEELITSPVGALLLWLGLTAAVVVSVSFLHLERAKGAAE